MKNILIIGDVHTEESAFAELDSIFTEIAGSVKDIEQVWFLGDIFENKKPTPKEYDFVTKWLITFQKLGEVTIVTGNHDATDVHTALDYARHLGIKIYNDQATLLVGNKTVYLGHHATDQGDEFVRDDKHKLSDLKKYDLALLGHLHNFHKLAPNVIHLGSIRRCSFGEVDYPPPCYAIIEAETLKIDFRPIKTFIPMKDVFSVKEALKQPARAKVRLILRSFQEFMANVNQLASLQQKFVLFSVKHDYQKVSEVIEAKEVTKKSQEQSFDTVFQKYLETIENPQVKTLLKQTWEEK